MITPVQRARRLVRAVNEGRVIRGAWTDPSLNRACLMAMYSPEVAMNESPQSCPATAMWPWLANISVPMDDNGSLDKWRPMLERYARVVLKLSKKRAWRNNKLGLITSAHIVIRLLDLVKPSLWHLSKAKLRNLEELRDLWVRVRDGKTPPAEEWRDVRNDSAALDGIGARLVERCGDVKYGYNRAVPGAAAFVAQYHVGPDGENTWDFINDIILEELERAAS